MFKFIGGDDIDQIMQCDEQEFLEIMSLVGMSSKPLHVRRLQRTLNVSVGFFVVFMLKVREYSQTKKKLKGRNLCQNTKWVINCEKCSLSLYSSVI